MTLTSVSFSSEPWKLALISVTVPMLMVSYILVCLGFYFRAYAPLKAKQMPILLLALISATFWAGGNMQQIGFLKGPLFDYCVLWSVWFQLVLGFNLFLSILTLRMLRLHFILVRAELPTGTRFWLIQALLFLPVLIMGIIPTIFPDRFVTSVPLILLNGDNVCSFTSVYYRFGMYACSVLQIILLVFLNISVRRVNKAFNEHSDSRVCLTGAIVVLLINVILVVTGIQKTAIGQIFGFGSQAIGVNYFFISMLGPPVYGLLFKREEYLTDWNEKLREPTSYRNQPYLPQHNRSYNQ